MTMTFENEKIKDDIFKSIHSNKDIKKTASLLNGCIFSATSPSCDPSLKKAGKHLLTALFAYICHYTSPSQHTMTNVIRLLQAGQVSEDDDTYRSPLDSIFEEIQEIDPGSFAVNQYNDFCMAGFKIQQSILAFCEARLKVFGFSDGKDEGVSSDESNRANQGSKNIVYYRRTGDGYNGLIFGGPEPKFRETGHGEPQNFPEKLNAYMAREKISPEQLSQDLKIPMETIQAWLNGKRLPRAGAMDALCRCLGCTKEELLCLQSAKCQEAEKDNIPRASDNGPKVSDDNDELKEEALSIGMQLLQSPELRNLFAETIILRKLHKGTALSLGMHVLQHPELHKLFFVAIILRKFQNP